MKMKLKKQFFIYNMLVVLIVVCIILLFSIIHTNRSFSMYQIVSGIIIILFITVCASCILSKIALKPLEKAWQQQLDFTANASHDLRTPLASLRLNLEIVQEEPEKTIEQQQKWLQNVSFEANRMSYILDNLLTLSRQDCGTKELVYSSFDINNAIQEVLNSFYPRAEQANIIVKTDFEPKLILNADLERFQQLITILTDNAILYAGRPSEFVIHSKKINKYIQITLSDTGIGIPANDLPRIFERFYRVDVTRSSKIKGTGLGLSIAKGIVEAHKGTIQVNSILNKGTTFTINFPIKK